ncbi:MAG TPA: BON domain-containing protein [Candidatus Elarobacter sp.]|jgi:osmotically-inducible protein OsmY|nr:BON domain-containing protein [Candidatus Elarobacter sp.]
MRRALALAAIVLLAGCTGSGSSDRAPQAVASAATSTLKDALILSAVKAALIAEDPDSTTSVGVGASNGVVTLRGTVRSAAIKSRFAARARSVTGVTSVVDDLRVDPNGPRLKQQIGDVALAARIQAAIAAQVGFERITVEVHDGVATLDGTVPDAKTRATAIATARGTSGIRNVVDHLRVGGS